MNNYSARNQISLKKVLLVEDDRFFGAMLVRKFSKERDLELVWAQTLAQSREIIASGKHDFLLRFSIIICQMHLEERSLPRSWPRVFRQ